MIRVLHVLSALSGGGVEAMLINYYQMIDRAVIHFDFVVHDKEVGFLEEKVQLLGSNVFHVIPKKTNPIQNFIQIEKIIRNGKFDVIHCHQGYSSIIPLLIAKHYRIENRIVHSHGAFIAEKYIDKFINSFFRKVILNTANIYCACTSDSAKYFFGESLWEQNKVVIIPNIINAERFKFDQNDRKDIRNEFGITEDSIVIGNIGRLYKEKNQSFLLDIFFEIQKINNRSRLMIIGKGPEEMALKEKVKELSMKETVIFTGERTDVSKLLSAMDVFVLPSLHEGFGIALIEAQASGLKCFASDCVISRDTEVSELVEYIRLDQPVGFWAEKINSVSNNQDRKTAYVHIIDAGLDSKKAGNFLEQFYLNLLKNDGCNYKRA